MQALLKLQPLGFVSIYEVPGGCHTQLFHLFLREINPPAPSAKFRIEKNNNNQEQQNALLIALASQYGCASFKIKELPARGFQLVGVTLVLHQSILKSMDQTQYVPFKHLEFQDFMEKHVSRTMSEVCLIS